MKDRYQFLHFEERTDRVSNRPVYRCLTNKGNDELGVVHWYPNWRQFCYFPSIQTVYSDGCLKDIADFIKQVTGEQLDRAAKALAEP